MSFDITVKEKPEDYSQPAEGEEGENSSEFSSLEEQEAEELNIDLAGVKAEISTRIQKNSIDGIVTIKFDR